MISIKEAVQLAIELMADLYGSEPAEQPLVEEVELSKDEKYWLITLGLSDTSRARSAIEAMTREELKPRRKVVKVDAETGKILSMKSGDV